MSWQPPFHGQAIIRYPDLRSVIPLIFMTKPIHASRNGKSGFASVLRRTLIELWAMLMMAGVVGFLGPFGTYLEANFLSRVGTWWALLMGAYVLVRPSVALWRVVAQSAALPQGTLVFWGVVVSSFPLATLWTWVSAHSFGALNGYTGLLPFALLCALAVLAVTWWSEKAEARLSVGGDNSGPAPADARSPAPNEAEQTSRSVQGPVVGTSRGETLGTHPRLASRLGADFQPPIIAAQSEDHYVRVHGTKGSELVLMRLRDAIAELDGIEGEQVHRSWWVARDAVSSVERAGRSLQLRLTNGLTVPVARESAERLQRNGFLPH